MPPMYPRKLHNLHYSRLCYPASLTNLRCPTPACTSRDASSKINRLPQKLTPDVSSQSLNYMYLTIFESLEYMLFKETPWPECLPVSYPTPASTSDGLNSSKKATKVKSKHKSTAPCCRKCTSNNLKKRRIQKRNSKLKAKLAKLRLEIIVIGHSRVSAALQNEIILLYLYVAF